MNQIPEKASFRQVAIADHGGGGKLMPTTFGEVVSFSEIMARSQHAIPKHLRDVPGACMAVTMQALRWEMDPFAVASKSYNVKDIISYEAQLIAAVVHTRAPITTRPDYEYTGDGADRRCKVSALFNDGVTRSYESPRVADIAVKNSPLWKADTDQQLGYYSVRAFARRYCPETILGVYTPEEAEQFRGPDAAKDITPNSSLAEKLAAGSGTAPGFSQDHVVNEIDGTPDASPGHPQPPSSGPETPPAAETAAQVESVAGSPSPEAESILPEGWEAEYANALRLTPKKLALPNQAKMFWEARSVDWEVIKATPDGETAAAIYNLFKDHFGKTEIIDAQLREMGIAA